MMFSNTSDKNVQISRSCLLLVNRDANCDILSFALHDYEIQTAALLLFLNQTY